MTGPQRAIDELAPGSNAPDLSLRLFGFRFADAGIEQRYQQWGIDRKIPLIRVGMIASAAGYAVYLLTVGLLEPTSFGRILPAVLAFLGLLTAIFLSTYVVMLRSLLVPMTVIANCISGLLLVWQIHGLIDTPDRFALSATAALIPVMFGSCVYQLRPLLASAAILPFIALSMSFLYLDFKAGDLPIAMSGSLAAMQLIACNTGIFVSSVIESSNRRTFRKDLIIDVQRVQLGESRDVIRRYVPPSVADLIIKGQTEAIDAPVRRRVTILFADIVGFTEVSELIAPEDLTALLGDYLSGMAEKVEEFGGTLTEFAGDGVMALFGAPDELSEDLQAIRAISAAREMQALMSRLNARWRPFGIERPLKMRIGINTGNVSVGSYGSRGRMTYTAIGLQTNIASRIERAAEPGSVLVSETTYQLARHAFGLEARGEVECKGLHHPVSIYSLATEDAAPDAATRDVDARRQRAA